eukprot:CAMPEP_0194715112 /NCGR_PEP_ID=MMETSP0296-20130528/6815_1 /TAXON_ID=39354 /ORGANISM="Heterosigma akashiwo, Strain CCMP2393" /LENGTH=106 /DNA_ID=CAMNT_0039614725 /DNA_START=66 /DNA_END=387 /DNA_ORIENTATION=+
MPPWGTGGSVQKAEADFFDKGMSSPWMQTASGREGRLRRSYFKYINAWLLGQGVGGGDLMSLEAGTQVDPCRAMPSRAQRPETGRGGREGGGLPEMEGENGQGARR